MPRGVCSPPSLCLSGGRVHGHSARALWSDVSFRKEGRRVTLQTERLLDDIGWRILEALQADARLSFSELGRQVRLSAPAAAERVRRMEDAGIIAGYRVDLALEKLFPMTAIIRISAPEENCTRLAACARGLEEVVEAHRVTGSDRLILTVSFVNSASSERPQCRSCCQPDGKQSAMSENVVTKGLLRRKQPKARGA